MGNVKEFTAKQFSEVFAKYFDAAVEKAKNNGDYVGLRDLEAAKDLYYLDYFADPINRCAEISAALNEEAIQSQEEEKE